MRGWLLPGKEEYHCYRSRKTHINNTHWIDLCVEFVFQSRMNAKIQLFDLKCIQASLSVCVSIVYIISNNLD